MLFGRFAGFDVILSSLLTFIALSFLSDQETGRLRVLPKRPAPLPRFSPSIESHIPYVPPPAPPQDPIPLLEDTFDVENLEQMAGGEENVLRMTLLFLFLLSKHADHLDQLPAIFKEEARRIGVSDTVIQAFLHEHSRPEHQEEYGAYAPGYIRATLLTQKDGISLLTIIKPDDGLGYRIGFSNAELTHQIKIAIESFIEWLNEYQKLVDSNKHLPSIVGDELIFPVELQNLRKKSKEILSQIFVLVAYKIQQGCHSDYDILLFFHWNDRFSRQMMNQEEREVMSFQFLKKAGEDILHVLSWLATEPTSLYQTTFENVLITYTETEKYKNLLQKAAFLLRNSNIPKSPTMVYVAWYESIHSLSSHSMSGWGLYGKPHWPYLEYEALIGGTYYFDLDCIFIPESHISANGEVVLLHEIGHQYWSSLVLNNEKEKWKRIFDSNLKQLIQEAKDCEVNAWMTTQQNMAFNATARDRSFQNPLFPTIYCISSHLEYFAECFALYCIGKLVDPHRSYFESMFKGIKEVIGALSAMDVPKMKRTGVHVLPEINVRVPSKSML
jgi:hypothetical protein